MLKTKDKIIKWLKKNNIKNYTINDDLTVDVVGNVDLSNKNLTKIPIQFGIVSSNFSCRNNKLTTLKGCPQKIGGNFNCGSNKLTSLEYGPKEIKGSFACYSNELSSLKGSPEITGRDFSCCSNKLSSLEDGPKKVGANFYCYRNELNSLKGGPEEVGGEIIFSPIKNINYLEEYKDKNGNIKINFNLLKKIMKSHELKESLESKLINKYVISKKFKI